MTPKEKAIELVNMYLQIYDGRVPQAKKCALIAVEEIIKIVPYENNDNAKYISNEKTIRYWQEIKQEIKKL